MWIILGVDAAISILNSHEFACKKKTPHSYALEGGGLCGDELNMFIKEVTGGRALLQQRIQNPLCMGASTL